MDAQTVEKVTNVTTDAARMRRCVFIDEMKMTMRSSIKNVEGDSPPALLKFPPTSFSRSE